MNEKKVSCWKILMAMSSFTAFVAWTLAICSVDVQAIGPENTTVGFASLNGFFHEWTGTHMILYTITDWLGFVPISVCLGFAVLGLVQLIVRKSFLKVDKDILTLGGYYLLVIAVYLLFEMFIINYRPVLISGYKESSYPSSTTLLTLCVMPTAILEIRNKLKNKHLSFIIAITFSLFTAFMVVGRTVSGVHWLTDIIGGILLSAGLVFSYAVIFDLTSSRKSFTDFKEKKYEKIALLQ